MRTGIIHSERFLQHDTSLSSPMHPERPDRLRAVVKQLQQDGLWDRLRHLPFEPAADEALLRVHEQAYIDRLKEACAQGKAFLDCPDCPISRDSEVIARLAAGGILSAVDHVMAGEVVNAFCALRPPGHHAEKDRAMGFCFYNHIAIAAEHCIARHALSRIAIVDFDVHHGNGTQHSFEDRDDVLVISLHQHPRTLYPGTGFPHECGQGPGVGNTLNIALMPNATDEVYRAVFGEKVLPTLDEFQPEFLLVSAGFDAAEADPLANMRVSTAGFAWMSKQLKYAADRWCEGRLVATLEGGYDLQALSHGVAAYISEMLED